MMNHAIAVRTLAFLVLSVVVSAPMWAAVPAGVSKPVEHRLSDGIDLESHASDTIDVVSYAIDIVLDFKTETISATCTVGLESLEAGLALFALDFVGLTVTGVLENGSVPVGYTRDENTIRITPSTTLSLGEQRTYAVSYHGSPEQGLHFDDENGGVCWVNTQTDESSRCWYPCRDLPADRADWYRGTITIPAAMQAASNGDLEQVMDNGDGTSTWHYYHDFAIATYLIMIAVSDYDTFTQQTAGGVPLKHFVYPEDLEDAEYDWENVPEMIDFFSGYYPYPYPTFGQAMAGFGSTLEHQTMVTLESSLVTGNRSFEETVAHELAHQWWGDLVGCHDWANIWLNEGFASYFEAMFLEHHYGRDRFLNWLTDRRDVYFSREGSSGPFSLYDPDLIFSTTVYYKGAWVLHMLRHLVGQETFAAIMHEYAARHAYSTAITDDFISAAEDVSGLDLDWFFQQWVYLAGFPRYRYDWSWEGGILTVGFDQIQEVSDEVPLFDMPVDLRIVTPAGTLDETMRVHLASETFTINVPQRPLRVLFDPDHWLLCQVSGPGALLAAPGPHAGNPCAVRSFDRYAASPGPEIVPYGVNSWGARPAAGDLDGDGLDEVITGPGPGAVFGPHVRAFELDGTPLGGVSFLAYGTPRYGVNVAAGELDGDGFDEIITGAGPGAVFGPHVRGWDYDGSGAVSPIAGISFFAYGTPRWGVNVACGDIDGDGFDEIVSGAGPGAVFGPHVRGWDYDGSGLLTPIPGVSFFAYGTLRWGVNVACGDIDGDGFDEMVSGAGPGTIFAAHIRAFDYDGSAVTPVVGISFIPYPFRFGAQVGCADLDGDGADEIIIGPGPDPQAPSRVLVYQVDGAGGLVFLSTMQTFEEGTHGSCIGGGRFLSAGR